MSYSKFNYKTIKSELGISLKYEYLFNDIKNIEPSETLSSYLNENLLISLFSEKARSEGIIFPVLAEIRRLNSYVISVYSGAILNADESKKLNGECDFILSKGEQGFSLDTPLFCMIEAEDNDIEKNIPQCVAQMEGANIYNKNEGNEINVIYGCVTTGTEWQFLRLENSICIIDKKRYHINHLEEILGILQMIIDIYK